MNEVFFNDLSEHPFCLSKGDADGRVSEFARILKFLARLNILKVRFEKSLSEIYLMDGYSLRQYLLEHSRSPEAGLLLSMARRPYIDIGSKEEEHYVNMDILLEKNGAAIDAEGLSCAYISDGFAVGFASEAFWKDNYEVSLVVEKNNRNKLRKRVFCISTFVHLLEEQFVKWLVRTMPIAFPASAKSKIDKKIKLRDDHGKDVLLAFADRLLKEPYIEAVVNSLPFNSHSKKCIRSISEDGLIEVVLSNTDCGYGLVVQTTAKSKIEAIYMAADIERKYLN